MSSTPGFAAQSPTSPLAPHQITRRAVGPNDVQIEIEFCGVCHTDIHQSRNDWGATNYPVVPGHEIVGKVSALGLEVGNLQIGQRVAVGCFVDSCHVCSSCKADMEQYCLGKLQQPVKRSWRLYLWRLLQAHCCGQAFCLNRSGWIGSSWRSTFAMRRYYDLLPIKALGGKSRNDRWHYWFGRAWSHGRKVIPRDGR